MDSVILPIPPPDKRAVLLWLVNRGVILALLLLVACLVPETPLQKLDNPMAMEGAGQGLGAVVLVIWGFPIDILFSLPQLILVPVFINKPLALPNAALRRRKFYCMVSGLQLVTVVTGGILVFPREYFKLEAFLGFSIGFCLVAGLYLAVALVSAKLVYSYWLADEYY